MPSSRWTAPESSSDARSRAMAASGPGCCSSPGDGRGLVQVTPEPLSGLADWSFSPDGRSVFAMASREEDARSWSWRATAAACRCSSTSGQRWTTNNRDTARTEPRSCSKGSNLVRARGASTRSTPSPAMSGPSSPRQPGGHQRRRVVPRRDEDRVRHLRSRRHQGNVADPCRGSGRHRRHPRRRASGQLRRRGRRRMVERRNPFDRQRWYAGADGDIIRSAIVPTDGSNVGIEIECASFASPDACSADWIWSPDDSVLLGTRRTQAAGRYRSSWPTH